LNNDQVSSALWFLFGLAVSLGSVHYNLGTLESPDSGFMPFLTGIVICTLSGVGFIHGTLRKRVGGGWSSVLKGYRWKNSLVILISLLAYALLLVPLGFFLCTTLFIALLLRAIAPQRWPVVIGGALGTAAASYLIFDVWLMAQLPKGPWGF
jgi:hypothetical protein